MIIASRRWTFDRDIAPSRFIVIPNGMWRVYLKRHVVR